MGDLLVAGVKLPCSTCKQVLTAVQTRLNEPKYGIRLIFENTALRKEREAARLGEATPSNICSLKVNEYFPP